MIKCAVCNRLVLNGVGAIYQVFDFHVAVCTKTCQNTLVERTHRLFETMIDEMRRDAVTKPLEE